MRAVVQPNLDPEVGFVERTDLVTIILDFQLYSRPKTGPVREYNFEGFFRYEPDTGWTYCRPRVVRHFARALFHNGAYTDDDF